MKVNNVNKLKGILKDSLQSWVNSKVDAIIPERTTAKVFAKNCLNNLIARNEEKLDKLIDGFFLIAADEKGSIDSDKMIDLLVEIFKEMPKKEYNFGSFEIEAGCGEVNICFPHNFLVDMFFGDLGIVKFTTEDFTELKKMIV